METHLIESCNVGKREITRSLDPEEVTFCRVIDPGGGTPAHDEETAQKNKAKRISLGKLQAEVSYFSMLP